MKATPNVERLNALPAEEAAKELLQCCGSKRWAQELSNRRPYSNLETLLTSSSEIWGSLRPDDWLEAFRSHPKIGEKKAAETVSAQTQQWSGQEQSGVSDASRKTADTLAELNDAYAKKFGFIFIICATGKSSAEMLKALRDRLTNSAATELQIAAAEQNRITELRLKKLVDGP